MSVNQKAQWAKWIARITWVVDNHFFMPKLDGTQIVVRLRERLNELHEGKEVAARDLRALLTSEQAFSMDMAWSEQQALRTKKRARTKEEEIALGWKTKREIHIEAYERAIVEADDAMPETMEKLQHDAQVRQARIYMESYSKALEAGKPNDVAENLANNDLTRADLRRVDGLVVGQRNRRDQEVWEMEQQVLQRASSEKTPEELEQIELWEKHEKALAEKRRKQSS